MRRALPWINLSFLILYPIAWQAPLARAGLLPFFSGEELTIFGGIADLWGTDVILAVIVALFAVIAPYLKVIALTLIQFGVVKSKSWAWGLELTGKLSMADVFLLALYIVLIKGVGVGHVDVAWGLYLFTALVLGSFGVAIATTRLERAAA